MRTVNSSARAFPPPGTVVSVPLWLFWRHKGIVSDHWCDGKPMVISGSARRGQVCEESWDTFRDGFDVQDDGYPSTLPTFEVILRVRALLGTRYKVFELNCDHVVAIAHGQAPQSPQVAGTVAVATLVVAFIAAKR